MSGARAPDKLHKVCVEDEYHIFVDTMQYSRTGEDPYHVIEFCKQRRSIENSYKSYEQLRPRTTNSHSVRIMAWFIPFAVWMNGAPHYGHTGIRGGRLPYQLHLCHTGRTNIAAKSDRPPD